MQVDRAMEAVGMDKGAEELRAWIEANLESSMRPSVDMICRKLLELGLTRAEAEHKAQAAQRRTSTLQGAVNFAINGSIQEGESVRREDMITGEVLTAREMFICECDCKHMLSYETFFCKILADVRDRCVPACPLNAIPNGCKYVLTQKETEDIISNVMRNEELRASLVDDATFALLELAPDEMLANGQRGWKSQLVSRIYMDKIKSDGSFVECPLEGCGWFAEAPIISPRAANPNVEVVCAKCGMRFCSGCRRLYHYTTPCDHMLTFARQWAEWLEEGRPRALERLAMMDERFSAALREFNSRREQHAADMRNRKEQYEQMLADERWKEQNCKRCPHCRFVVNKLR